MHKILIVDDDAGIRQQLKWGLGDQYLVQQAGYIDEALELFKIHKPDAVLLDLGLPPHENSSKEGFRGLAAMLELNPHIKVIVLTGSSERENALQAIQMGAYDFYAKPPVLSELRIMLTRLFHLTAIEEQNRLMQRTPRILAPESSGMIGESPEMQTVFATIRKVASTNASVFIAGESGTGKELVAKAIHTTGLRKAGPFIPINCGAIPENLLESELFGHEKGAFSDAHSMVQGKLQYAHKGTLFLDEIGELPFNLQVKLLRFLQEGVIQRVGGRNDISVDTRVVSATNVGIEKAISDGRFREDLFYRIGVITITLPALRERGSDILLLANHFITRFNREHNKKVRCFSASAVSFMQKHTWPGNVRELQNRVQRAIIMSSGSVLKPEDLGSDVAHEEAWLEVEQPRGTLREAKDRIEREYVIAAMDRHRGSIGKAADELGVSRPRFYELIKKYIPTPLEQ